MGRFAFRTGDKADEPKQEGSTIPRVIRMGPMAPAPIRDAPKAQATNTRDAQRFVPLKTKTFLTVSTGKKLDARIINMSASAVAVEADFSVTPPSTVTIVGSHPVKLGRKIALGAVFLFLKPIPPDRCTEAFII